MEYVTTLLLLTLSIFINAIIIGSIGFFITNSIRKKGNKYPFNWWVNNGRGFYFYYFSDSVSCVLLWRYYLVMKKVLIAGCAQEISSFNPVECKYEIFHIIQGNEIYDYHLGKKFIYWRSN